MKVGPVSSDLQPAGFGGGQGVFVGLGGSQGAGRIQLHQIISFEHTFNIKGRADTLRPFGRLRQTDNTTLILTTPPTDAETALARIDRSRSRGRHGLAVIVMTASL